MPDTDGIEATRRIMALDAGAPILMVTSYGQEQMVLNAIDAGAKGYVLKPIREEKLRDVIDKAVAKYRSRSRTASSKASSMSFPSPSTSATSRPTRSST